MKRLIYILMMLMFAGNVHARVISVAKGQPIPVTNGILAVASGDSILLEAGGIYDGDIIVRAANIYIGRYGVGNDPVIKPAGSGAQFAILQQAVGLICENIFFDGSDCDGQASYFLIRMEGIAKYTTINNCKFKWPSAEAFARNQTSRIQMNFTALSIDNIEYSELTVLNSEFIDVPGGITRFMEKAASDSTIVVTGVSISEVSP